MPAVRDNGGKTVRAEAVATGKHENLEIGKRRLKTRSQVEGLERSMQSKNIQQKL